ncbi:hypothetical protein RUM43_009204 [Polyplax serrata]|uniref:Uncharacterized protein n=1 Tax=Polyplax serrata TaxID=468196 RepID=A0AAN8NVN6_POLSC
MASPEIFQALVCLVLLTCPGTNGYRCPPVRDADCTRETCQILSGEFKYGGRSWTGFCSRNRSFFFSKWKCRGKEFDPAKAGTYLLKVGQTCRLKSSSSSSSEGFHRWDLPCLERYNWKRCHGRRSSRENSTTSQCLRVKSNYVSIRAEKDGGVISKRHYSRSRFSFPVSTEAYFPIDSLNNKNDSSMGKRRFSSRKIHISKRRIPRQSTAAGLAKKTKTKKSESFGKRAISGERDNSPRSKLQASHLMPCKENEKFYNNSCYYFTTYRLMDPPDEDLHLSDTEERSLVSEEATVNFTKYCRIHNEHGLGLAVRTKKENRFIMQNLVNLTIPMQAVVLTSGILPVGQPGYWQDWNLLVDENEINCTAPKDRSEVMLYAIDFHRSKWTLMTLSNFLGVHNPSMWHIICKRQNDDQQTMNEQQRLCVELYRKSECYNPSQYVKYCCAADERGVVWVGCPNNISVNETADGLECTWNCGDDGFFIQEYPICRKKIACEVTYNNVTYSAPLGRHAIGKCPSSPYGYSTWLCASNKTFVDTPTYKCCETDNMCRATDSYLNMWVSCRAHMASKRLICPPDSLLSTAEVKWYCTDDSVFEGDSPDYSVCNGTKLMCQGRDRHDREWKVGVGRTANKRCPTNAKGRCYWTCNWRGSFETSEPDCSTCQITWADEISDKIKNGTHYKVVMKMMENRTRLEDLTVGFSRVLGLTSDCVNLYKNQTYNNETEFHYFLLDYSQILKNLVGRPDIWSTFLVSSRRDYTGQILNTSRNAAFAFLNLSKKSGNSSESYNATLADFKEDGFDFFVQYRTSFSGVEFPLEDGQKERNWRLVVNDVNGTGSKYAAMGLVMNHTLAYLMFPAGNKSSGFVMNSPVVTFTVATSEAVVSDVSVSLTFKHINRTRQPESGVIRRRLHDGESPAGVLGSTLCYYFGQSDWDSQGCVVTQTSSEATSCTCSHLSTIGLLMSIHRYEPDAILEMISVVSSSISIMSLILAVLVFYTFDTVRNERVLIGVNLCLCLMAGHFLLVTVTDKKFFYISDGLCTVYAIITYYAFMAAFAWMFMEGCHLYRMLILVFESNIEFRLIYILVGYGLPVVLIGGTELIGIALGDQPYGQDEMYCFPMLAENAELHLGIQRSGYFAYDDKFYHSDKGNEFGREVHDEDRENQIFSIEKLDTAKSGTKIFAITQSGVKSSEVSPGLDSSNGRGKRLKKFFQFAFCQPRDPAEQVGPGNDETSSGIELEYDAAAAAAAAAAARSSQVGTLGSGLSTGNCKFEPERDGKQEKVGESELWQNHGDFPELSYHTNYYSNRAFPLRYSET